MGEMWTGLFSSFHLGSFPLCFSSPSPSYPCQCFHKSAGETSQASRTFLKSYTVFFSFSFNSFPILDSHSELLVTHHVILKLTHDVNTKQIRLHRSDVRTVYAKPGLPSAKPPDQIPSFRPSKADLHSSPSALDDPSEAGSPLTNQALPLRIVCIRDAALTAPRCNSCSPCKGEQQSQEVARDGCGQKKGRAGGRRWERRGNRLGIRHGGC